MDAWEQQYYSHRQFSNSPVRQAEYDLMEAERVAEQQAERDAVAPGGEDTGMLERIMGLPLEAGKGVVEGVWDLGKGVSDLTQWLRDKGALPADPGPQLQVPKPGFTPPKGVPEGLARGLGAFLPAFLPASKAVGLAGTASRAGRVAKGAVAGGVADFAGDPDQGNLFNLISDVAGERSPAVVEALKTSQDEGQLRKRLKNALAGAPLGVGLDTTTEALTHLWRRGRARGFGKQIEQAFEAGEKAAPKAEAEVTLDADFMKKVFPGFEQRYKDAQVRFQVGKAEAEKGMTKIEGLVKEESEAWVPGVKTVVAEAGGEWLGATTEGAERYVWFNDPVTKSTHMMPVETVSKHNIQDLMGKSRSAFAWAEAQAEQRGVSIQSILAAVKQLATGKYRKLMEAK